MSKRKANTFVRQEFKDLENEPWPDAEFEGGTSKDLDGFQEFNVYV